MPKVESFIDLAGIKLERDDEQPLYQQLYQTMRRTILQGQLTSSTRLPSSRALAQALAVSRNTVVTAFDKLLAEGYLESQVGAGTFVASCLPEELLQLPESQPAKPITAPKPVRLSKRGQQLATILTPPRQAKKVRPFVAGLPAMDHFPFKVWESLTRRRWRTAPKRLLSYGDVAGYRPLREAIADYLRTARGVNCEAEQVLMVAGAQQGIDLVVRMLLNPGEAVWVENPGYGGVQGVLQESGAKLIPVPVDEEGLQVAVGQQMDPQARLAYITPSHQYPLGVTMSLSRRLQLLQWAAQNEAWILEDDYDSEYRYTGQPLAALQGLDRAAQVIYLGTFSKVLFPALRLGYLVVPPSLVVPFERALSLMCRGTPIMSQVVLADFIEEGHFARHIRRMRTLYAQRQQFLMEAVTEAVGELLEIKSAEAGLHLFGWLPRAMDDQAISRQLAERGITAATYHDYALTPAPRGGLVLGYAAIDENEIRAGMRILAQVLTAAAG